MSGDPAWIRRLDALYGLALRLYPRRFRTQWEAPMRQAFRDRCREVARGQRRPGALLAELLPDLALGLGRERIHDLGDGTMSKRNLLLAMLVLLAATIALHERIGAAGNAALDAWKQHRARVHAEAEREYWTSLARAMAPARAPRDETVAAVAWQVAGSGLPALPGDPGAAAQARDAFQAALAGRDPAALWLAATDCPVRHCDEAGAIAMLQRLAPGNAAVAWLAFNHADATGDAEGRGAALRQLAASGPYHGYDADLLKSMLQADARASAPSHVAADELVAGVAMAWVILDSPPLLDACRPGLGDADACRAAGRALAAGNALVARAVGARILYRYAAPGPQRVAAASRLRDFHWLIRNIEFGADAASIARWREAWLAGDGEVAVYQANLAARGIPLHAPADFQLDPRYLDPSR